MLKIDLRYPTPERRTFKPAGVCIYCGSGPGIGRLTREHIIAHGLSGTLILPQSSCPSCSRITGGIEGFYLQKMIRDARLHLKLASRRHRRDKSPPPQLAVNRIIAPGLFIPIQVEPEKHPYWLITLGLAPPGAVIGADDNYAPLIEHQMIPGDNWSERWGQYKGISVEYQVDANLFARMLAKIAHSFAVAVLGPNGFAPTLPPIILGTDPKHAKFVGGLGLEDDDRTARPGVLHSIAASWESGWFIVRLRLFSFLDGSPSYVIVAGRAN